MEESNLDRDELEQATRIGRSEDANDSSSREVWLAMGHLFESERPRGDNDALLERLRREIHAEQTRTSSGPTLKQWWWVLPSLATAASIALLMWNQQFLAIPLENETPVVAVEPLTWDPSLRAQIAEIDETIDQTNSFGETTREFATIESDLQTLAASLNEDSL